MPKNDIRWLQRFDNYNKSLQNLLDVVEEYRHDNEISEAEKAGMIKFFEMTYELAWNTIKDYYEDQGETGIQGSKDAIKLAFNRGLIANANQWFDMIDSRKLSVHTYNQATADKIAHEISETYADLFVQLQTRLQVEKLDL